MGERVTLYTGLKRTLRVAAQNYVGGYPRLKPRFPLTAMNGQSVLVKRMAYGQNSCASASKKGRPCSVEKRFLTCAQKRLSIGNYNRVLYATISTSEQRGLAPSARFLLLLLREP